MLKKAWTFLLLQLAEPLPHGTRSLFIKRRKSARKNLSNCPNKILKNKTNESSGNNCETSKFWLSIYKYIYSYILCKQVFFYLAYTLKHMSWHKYLLGFHVSLLPAFSALLFVSVANTQESRCLLSLSNLALPFTLIKENRLIPLFSFELRRKMNDQKPFLTGFKEI